MSLLHMYYGHLVFVRSEHIWPLIYIYVYKHTYIYIYIYIYIYLLIVASWIAFHQCHLSPQTGKTLMIYITSKNCKVSLFRRSGKSEVLFCTYLYIWFYFHEVQSIAPTPFIQIWLFFSLFISPMHFTSTRRKIL